MNLCDGLQGAESIQIKDVKYPCRAEIKYDGVRLAILGNKFYTKNSKQVILPTVKVSVKEYMIDLEVVVNAGKLVDRSEVSGLMNSAMKGGVIDDSVLRFIVFDAMVIDAYHGRIGITNLKERINLRNVLIPTVLTDARFLTPEYRDIYNKQQLEEYFESVISKGYEGLVIKHYEDLYQFKKCKDWGRIKKVRTADLMCVATASGNGKYSEAIGALSLVGTVEDKEVGLSVGSGMTDYDRCLSPNHYLDKTIEIKYSHITQDKKTLKYSLNQPRFVMVRHDK